MNLTVARSLLFFVLTWILPHACFSQSFSPNPGNATLYIYTDQWTLWHVTKNLETTFPRASYESSFYLQKNRESSTRLVYKAVEGQIQSFSPVWIHADGTVIAWDINFSYLDKDVHLAEKEPFLPNSTYYPVLVNCNSSGVVLMANNEQTSADITSPLYFLPWSFDRNVVHYDDPQLITDSAGVPFYSSRVFISPDRILSYRPPYFFRYDLKNSQLDVREVETLQSLSEVVAFDGGTVVFKNLNTLYAFTFESKHLDSVSVTDNCMVLACRGQKIFCIQPQALTMSDSFNLMLQSYDLKKAAWITHKEIFRGDIQEETGTPVHMILKDRLKIWINKRWFDLF